MKYPSSESDFAIIFRKIEELPLSALARSEAIAALHTADVLVTAVALVSAKLAFATRWATASPKLKPQ